jgi:hypothetical protein
MKYTPNPRPLPFPDWVDQTYPQKTAAIKFLRVIGALDVAYLMYVMKAEKLQKKEAEQKKKTPKIIPAMPLKVEEITIEQKTDSEKKPAKPKAAKKEKSVTAEKPAKKAAKPKHVAKPKTEKTDELTIEFEHKPEPIAAKKPVEKEPEPIEPEPLILHEEPAAATPKRDAWIDDESLEDIDLRKSGQVLKTGSTAVSFDVIDVDDEQETRLMVNEIAWRAMLPSPALNLSRMAQIIRVSYGELYTLGRMALGAMSGECYITADEATRIVSILAACTDKTTEVEVACFDRNKTSKNRKTSRVRIRFERC